MHMKHQFLFDVFQLHARQFADSLTSMMANAGHKSMINAGISIGRGHRLLHVFVMEKPEESRSRLPGQPIKITRQRWSTWHSKPGGIP